MLWFNNLRVSLKLLLANTILGVLIVILALVAHDRLRHIGSNADTMGSLMSAVELLLNADRDLYQVLVAERSMIFSRPGSDEFKALANMHEENMGQARERLGKLKEFFSDPKVDQLYADYLNYRDRWERLTNKIRAEREANTRIGRSTAIEISFGSAAEAFSKMHDQIDLMVAHIEALAKTSAQETKLSVAGSQTFIMTLLLVSLCVAAAIAYFFPKTIVGPLLEMTERIRELAGGGGDLTSKVHIHARDEVGGLGEAVNEFIDSLRGLLSQIVVLGDQFLIQSQDLKSSSQRNNKVADDAMKEIDQLATSITEMSASVQEVAQNASGAASQAQQASEDSARGQVVVDATKGAINELSAKVQHSAIAIDKLKQDAASIDDVVNVIRGIAEQTNLLALNAAIEAARAGEQGRGFAVVADEVRALASRTQTSTEEIQQMIEELQNSAGQAYDAMEHGKSSAEVAVEQASQAGASLEEVNRAISHMADMNIQIAAAAEQQSAVSEEISVNANKLSMFSKDASELSDEVNSSAQDMEQSASELGARLSKFKI